MIRLPTLAPRLAAGALLIAAPACTTVPDERPTTPIAAVTAAPPAPPAAAPGPRREVVRIVWDRIEGAEAARARAAFAPVQGRVADCHPGGAVVRLRLVAKPGSAQYSVEPDTTLDGRARRCVLETLSTIEIEGLSGDASPSARPSGFSALFRIEW